LAAVAAVAAVVPGLALGDFKQPGGGVYCAPDRFIPPTLACWRAKTGLTLAMRPTGRPSFDTLRANRNTREDSAPPLRYGRTWHYLKDFTCTMSRKGVTCKNRSKHGWFLGRTEGYRLF
jgi:hypothetical protein